MSSKVFVDTNVLVYTRDSTDLDKHEAARAWMEALWATASGRVSTQVLQEYYVTVTRKLKPGLDRLDARADVNELQAWRPVTIDQGIFEDAWEVEDRFGFSFWDALMVAAARSVSAPYLLTDDLQDGMEVDGTTIISPFSHDPAAPGD